MAYVSLALIQCWALCRHFSNPSRCVCVISVLQIKKPRLREGEGLALGHVAWRVGDWPGLIPKARYHSSAQSLLVLTVNLGVCGKHYR